jgi:hypothetical protein
MEMRNSKRALITFGLVHTELQRTNDFLKGIAPIFTVIAGELEGEPFREEVFQQKLNQRFGLRLPEEILSSFPPKLQSVGLCKRRETSSGPLYFWTAPETGLPEQKVIVEAIDKVVSNFQRFLDRENDILNVHWDREKI